MKMKFGLVGGLVALVVVLGAIFLYSVEIPAPSQPVEKTLSDDAFPR